MNNTSKKIADMTRLDWLLRTLTARVDAGDKARQVLAQKLTLTIHDAERALSWSFDSFAPIAAGSVAQHVIDRVWLVQPEQDDVWRDATLRKLLSALTQQLSHWRPEHSTNPTSNLVNEAKYTAMRDVIDMIELHLVQE